jgi:hypothetical protein
MDNNLEPINAGEWCQEQLENYDSALQALTSLRDSPQGESVSGIIRSAKLNRAERMLAIADAKANAAEFVKILSKISHPGEIYIDIPGVAKARIRW